VIAELCFRLGETMIFWKKTVFHDLTFRSAGMFLYMESIFINDNRQCLKGYNCAFNASCFSAIPVPSSLYPHDVSSILSKMAVVHLPNRHISHHVYPEMSTPDEYYLNDSNLRFMARIVIKYHLHKFILPLLVIISEVTVQYIDSFDQFHMDLI